PTNPSTSSVSLQERGMTNSFYEFTHPFFSDPILLEEYTNASGRMQTGTCASSSSVFGLDLKVLSQAL
ncbi:hypothetical protein DL96DRAFT_1468670, partial [Flagelloscypha sp. PMI_526]